MQFKLVIYVLKHKHICNFRFNCFPSSVNARGCRQGRLRRPGGGRLLQTKAARDCSQSQQPVTVVAVTGDSSQSRWFRVETQTLRRLQ